jgi:predicted AlkP superfamily phosphohydrolase/phosphomutase
MNNPEFKLGPDIGSDLLELRAAEQRQRLHQSVQELRERVKQRLDVKKRLQTSVQDLRETVKERLEVRKDLRQRFGPAAGVVAAVGLLMGYGVASIVRR